MRDQVVQMVKFSDDMIYNGIDSESQKEKYLTLDDCVYDEKCESELSDTVKRSNLFRYLYAGKLIKILHPERYRIIVRNGKPYKVGTGNEGRIYLAQDLHSNELVAVKTFSPGFSNYRILKECGCIHKAQTIFASECDFEPVKLIGLFKLKNDSRLTEFYHDIMLVMTLAGLAKNVPVCLPLRQAKSMASYKLLDISLSAWSDILYNVVRGVKLLHDGGLQHGDYHMGNICIGYHDERLKLTIIDFGFGKLYSAVTRRKYSDLYQAITTVRNIAEVLELNHTYEYTAAIVDKANENAFEKDPKLEELYNFENVLQGVDQMLQLDVPAN